MNNYIVWLTTDCNLRCKYCYEGESKKHISISQETANKVVDFICNTFSKKEDELRIDFHGGEPLLNFEILKFFIKTFKMLYPEKKKKYSITTNATLLNEEQIGYLVQNVKNISVSIDGSKEKHDRYRVFPNGKGSYEIAISNSMKLLSKLQEKLRVRMTFGADTVLGIGKDMEQLYAMGFKTVAALPDIFNPNWSKKDFDVLEKEIVYMKQHITDADVYFNLMQPLVVQKKGKCAGGINEIDIYPDGKLYPCTMATGIPEFQIGDVILGISADKRDRILSYSECPIDTCIDCDMYCFCECIRCRIVNKLTMEDYNSPNVVQCLFNNTIMRANGYLIQ